MRTPVFDYDQALPLHVLTDAERVVGDVSITDVSYDHGAGGRARAYVVTGRRGGAGVVLAHGGSADGRRFLVDEAVELARRGFVVVLPATSFPAHGDIDVTTRAIRVAVLTQRRGVDLLTSSTADITSYLDAVDGFDPVHYVAVKGHRRLLFQYGSDDETVRMYEAAAPPRQWSEHACGHGTDADPSARKERANFFSSTL